MKVWMALVVMLAACGQTDATIPDDGGFHITRGTPGTGPADAGGLFAMCKPCSAATSAECPFQDAGGTCYHTHINGADRQPPDFCGLPQSQVLGCPEGSGIGTPVGVPLCIEFALSPSECPPFTNYYLGFCIPF